MLPLLLELLGILLLIVVVAGVVLLLGVAFRSPSAWQEQDREARRWQPPFARGKEIFDWARETASKIVGRRLSKERSHSTPTKLSADIHDGAMEAMLPLLTRRDQATIMPCPLDGQGMIGVTPPEAIAIADYIRQHLSRGEAIRIHALAVENAKRLADGRENVPFDEEAHCALLNCEHICRTYPVRPLQCRPMHARMIGRREGLELADQEDRRSPAESFLVAVQKGIEAGLVEELENAGLDASSYELNSALVVALDTPDAADRWLHGDNIFAECKVCAN